MNLAAHPMVTPLIFSALLIFVKGFGIGLSRFFFLGTKKLNYQTFTPGSSQGPRWYSSLNRAYINAIESFAVFAPAVILHAAGSQPGFEMGVTLAWTYLFSRIVYDLIYIFVGYSIWVSFAWIAGVVASMVLWINLLMAHAA